MPAGFAPADVAQARRPSLAGLRAGLAALMRADRLPDIAIGLAFSAFFLLQIARHAMWRDELNAWGLVLDSRSLGSLFTHMHYEGHPGLWHLLLWFASGVSTAPVTMQVVHAALVLGLIWFIALAAPFGRGEKILILLGYYVLFDYTVVSRNYGIGLLLALVYAQRRARHPEQIGRNALLLGLLANTNVFELMLAGALALEYGWSLRRAYPTARAWLMALAGPAALLLTCAAFSVATFWPAADISWRTTGRPLAKGLSVDGVVNVLANNLSALVPLDAQAFWYSEAGPRVFAYPMLRMLILASAPLVVVAYLRLLAPAPRLLLVPALTFLGAVVFNLVFYEGYVRHWGINLVAFLSVLWILRASVPGRTPWALPFLALGAAAGVLFTAQHWTTPFSSAGATANWIRREAAPDVALMGTPDTHVAAVAELLGRPITFLDCDCTDTYLAYHRRRDAFSMDQTPERLLRAAQAARGRPILYLNKDPATHEQVALLASNGLTLRQRAAFTGATLEDFYVYEIGSGDREHQPGITPAP